MEIFKNKKLLLPLFFGLNLWLWFLVLTGRPAQEAKFYFWDVGQGDSELVIMPSGQSILIDCGPDGNYLNRLSAVMAGHSRIDLLIISHPHEDHYRGLFGILDSFSVGAVLVSREALTDMEIAPILNKPEVHWATLDSGDRLILKGGTADIFKEDRFPDLNERSLVAAIKTEGITALFAGDIGFYAEKQFIKSFTSDYLKADLLKVPHHGSGGSSSEAFLAVVRPRIAVVEVGANNRYGLPNGKTLQRLGRYAEKILRTDKVGDILIKAKDGEISILSRR